MKGIVFLRNGIICLAVAMGILPAVSTPQPGLVQYRMSGIPHLGFLTPENIADYRDDAAGAVVVPGVLMGKPTNVNGTVWDEMYYPFVNGSGYWYEGYMKLESDRTYSGYSRFDDGGCIYLDGVELYNQGAASGYNADTSRERTTYTPARTGWYKVQLGIWDWANNRSCQNGTIAGVQWSTNPPPVSTGVGTGSLWREFWDADADHATVARGDLFFTEDPSVVRFSEPPTVSMSGGDFVMTAKTVGVLSGAKVYAVFGPSYPFAYTNLLGEVGIGEQTLTAALSDVPADVNCRFGVISVSNDNLHRVVEMRTDESFMNGVVSITLGRNAVEGRIDQPGIFVVERPSSAVNGDLVVRYSVGGTALSGRDFYPLPGVVVIPRGETSVNIEVVPRLRNGRDHQVVIALDDVNFRIDGSGTASMSISAIDVHKQIVFRTDGYSGAAALTNFPVLVRLSEGTIDGFHYRDFALSRGEDLHFALPTGQVLPHEIEKWDESGTSLVWVRIPVLTAETEFLAYYGGDSAGEGSSRRVWSDNFLGVWHFDEVLEGVAFDATGHDLSVTNRFPESTAVSVSAGLLGGAIDNVVAKGFLTRPFTNFFAGAVFSVSGWFRRNGIGAGNARYLSSKTRWDDAEGFELDTSSSGVNSLTVTTGSRNRFYPPCSPSATDDWQKYTLVFDHAKASFYTNGVPTMTERDIVAPVHGATGFAIGNNAALSESCFTGWIDEVRFAMFAESADWVKAEYDTESCMTFLSNTGVTPFLRRGFVIIHR